MPNASTVNELKSKTVLAFFISAALLVVVGGLALAAQDRYTLKIPDGLAFSEFRGYETWQDVAVSQTETSLKVIAANDAMINAYRNGIPGNGKPFPDGSKITKIEWSFKKNSVSPYFVTIPDTLKTVAFIYVGLAGLTLGVERVELKIEVMLGRFARVDRAPEELSARFIHGLACLRARFLTRAD